MSRQASLSRTRLILRAVAIGALLPLVSAQAQEIPDTYSEDSRTIDEIVVTVDRGGKRVDPNAIRLQEARLKVLREFQFEQYKQEEELWRLRLRSTLQRRTSRIAWGYDAQSEAARFRYTQADYLPIDRVRPATFVSIRF
jgi:hypothetical protein